MKPKTMILMVVAVGCGLGASYMTSRLIAERSKPTEVEEVPVLVAKVKVNGWMLIKEPHKYFEIRMFRKTEAPKKALTSLDDIKDQKLNKPIDETKAVTQDDLLNKAETSMQDKLKAGQRAIGIKVNPMALAGGHVLPETYVDILCVTSGQEASSKIVLQNMLVLAVDAEDVRNPEKKSILGNTVTLAASAEEATALALAQKVGELWLMLKGQGDTQLLPSIVVRPEDLGKGPRSTIPVQDKPETEDRVVAGDKNTPLPDVRQDDKPEPAAPSTAAAPAEQKNTAEKKKTFHYIRIQNGGDIVRQAVRLNIDDEEEGDDAEGNSGGAKKPDRPEAKKPEPARPAPAASGPASAGPNRTPRTRR